MFALTLQLSGTVGLHSSLWGEQGPQGSCCGVKRGEKGSDLYRECGAKARLRTEVVDCLLKGFHNISPFLPYGVMNTLQLPWLWRSFEASWEELIIFLEPLFLLRLFFCVTEICRKETHFKGVLIFSIKGWFAFDLPAKDFHDFIFQRGDENHKVLTFFF